MSDSEQCLNWPKLDFDFGQLCMCIGVNNLGGSFEKSPNVVLTKIQNFIEIQVAYFGDIV